MKTRASKKIRAIDLFSGCGGLTLGLKQAGFQVLGAVDIDSLSVRTYRANHPGVRIWQTDIGKISSAHILAALKLKVGELDLLAGCPPCQGFSSVRTLNGNKKPVDARNDLIFDFLRLAKGIRPRTIMMENVPGLITDDRFQKFCSELQRHGYFVRWAIKDAQHYRVPQRRKRLILIASRIWYIPFALPQESKQTVEQALWGLGPAGRSGDPPHDMGENRTAGMKLRIAQTPKNGGSRLDLEMQLPCHNRCNGFKDVYGRMAWRDVAPTITGGCFNPSKGRFLHPAKNRAITMREAAILQGFPHGYSFPDCTNKSSVALMIGNALPPPFIAAHARCIANSLQRFDRRSTSKIISKALS